MEIYQVDAFTNRIFSGNPAGVCLLPAPKDEEWMGNVAAEMNLSETAFLEKQAEGFNLRWFTPVDEVDLCGHATLASAHMLWETGVLSPTEEARFFTKSGLLTAQKNGEWIELNFPAEPDAECEAPAELEPGLGAVPLYTGKNRMDYIVELDSEEAVLSVQPDMALLQKIKTRGIIITARAGSTEYDFVSRFFAPAVGVPEDPVTGSAHCCLGPFWQKRLKKDSFTAYQASKRGGTVQVKAANDRVILGGRAVTVFRAEFIMQECLH
ncbi:MAG: PhzF family phenazine biosynthesis protein [bacterium]|nr:PhzF family phenazine biosynthesis protein [bacterium]